MTPFLNRCDNKGRAVSNCGRPISHTAFTLIEIIGVLAILAILAAAIAPALIKEADIAAQNTEATNLVTFANAFQEGSLHQRYIPDLTHWATFIATNAGWQTSGNAVLTNSYNNARAFLIDTNLSLGSIGPSSLPYQQDVNPSGASAPPANVRFMIISSVAPISLPISTGIPSSNDFDSLWATPANAVPTGTSMSWNGFKLGDVQVQRINLTGMFHHLVLSNASTTYMVWELNALNSTSTASNSPGGQLSGYFFTSTPFQLLVNGGVSAEAAQILLQDCSYSYQCGIWRSSPAVSLQGIAETFINVGNGAATLPVCSNMVIYMTNYIGYEHGLVTKAVLQSSQSNLSTSILSITP